MQHDCPTQVQSESNVPQTNVRGNVDLMFRAFSDRTRLRILSLLLRKRILRGRHRGNPSGAAAADFAPFGLPAEGGTGNGSQGGTLELLLPRASRDSLP